jgi:hypothetical protein
LDSRACLNYDHRSRNKHDNLSPNSVGLGKTQVSKEVGIMGKCVIGLTRIGITRDAFPQFGCAGTSCLHPPALQTMSLPFAQELVGTLNDVG